MSANYPHFQNNEIHKKNKIKSSHTYYNKFISSRGRSNNLNFDRISNS